MDELIVAVFIGGLVIGAGLTAWWYERRIPHIMRARGYYRGADDE